MPTQRHLRKAPIVEAVVDIKIRPRPDFKAEDLGELKAGLLQQFPKVEERRGGQVTFQLGAPLPPQMQDLGFQGLVFRTEDGRFVLQLTAESFTLSRLQPYTSWEELFPFAWSLWERYREFVQPDAVSRLGVRYINRIPIPLEDNSEFGDFINLLTRVPPDLPDYMSAFYCRMTLHNPAKELNAHVTQAFGPEAAEPKLLVLDTDAFRTGDWEAGSPDIKAIFGQLHALKNEIFFASLTDRTLSQFE